MVMVASGPESERKGEISSKSFTLDEDPYPVLPPCRRIEDFASDFTSFSPLAVASKLLEPQLPNSALLFLSHGKFVPRLAFARAS